MKNPQRSSLPWSFERQVESAFDPTTWGQPKPFEETQPIWPTDLSGKGLLGEANRYPDDSEYAGELVDNAMAAGYGDELYDGLTDLRDQIEDEVREMVYNRWDAPPHPEAHYGEDELFNVWKNGDIAGYDYEPPDEDPPDWWDEDEEMDGPWNPDSDEPAYHNFDAEYAQRLLYENYDAWMDKAEEEERNDHVDVPTLEAMRDRWNFREPSRYATFKPPEHWSQPDSSINMHSVEHLPVRTLMGLREFDRPLTGDYVEALRQSIAEHGVHSPVILNYNPDTQAVWVAEGNHRIKLADELGLDSIPARVMRWHGKPAGPGRYEDGTIGLGGGRASIPYPPDQFNYVPQDLKPSQIGIR